MSPLEIPSLSSICSNSILAEAMEKRILLLDGAMGSMIYAYEPTEEDYRGARFASHPVPLKNCTEALLLSKPDMIRSIHCAYLEAGADIIETDSFNSNRLSMGEFHLDHLVGELNRRSAEIAKDAAEEYTRKNPGKPRFVAGSIGPTKKTLSLGTDVEDPGRRSVTFDEMVDNYEEQIAALVDGGVDILLPETTFDTLVLKACLYAIQRFFDKGGKRVPVMVSGTIFDNGRTLSAQPVESFALSVEHFPALSIGLNCAVGVEQMRPHLEKLAQWTHLPISCYPNAGMPDGFGGFTGSIKQTAEALGEFASNGWLNFVGGCCGTTPDWIREIGKAVELKPIGDITVVASGSMVATCLSAAKILEETGLSVGVVNMHTLRPLDETCLTSIANQSRLIVSAEEHAVTSGLNSVVGDFLQRNKFNIPLIKLGLPPKFLENGSYEYLMKRYELDADSIVKKS